MGASQGTDRVATFTRGMDETTPRTPQPGDDDTTPQHAVETTAEIPTETTAPVPPLEATTGLPVTPEPEVADATQGAPGVPGPPVHGASPERAHRTPGRSALAALVAAALFGATGLGYALGASGGTTTTASSSTTSLPSTTQDPTGGSTDGSTAPDTSQAQPGTGGFPGGTFSRPSTETESTPASAEQQTGVVLITSTSSAGEGAGTGMVLTSDGLVLTNHHVVEGAESVEVEVASTGETYDAEVLGYDDVKDVAVLQLEDASGLDTVSTDTSEAVAVGDDVVGVGNAGGTGEATAAAGTVTATDQTIDVADESTGSSSTLSGLIEVDADIVAGDSGGPLYDDDGEVVGMDTAASTGSADVTGYAVPIGTALDVVDQVLDGDESGSVSVGPDAFLGVQLQSGTTGAVVVGTVDGSAAQSAGLEAGSTVTSVDGTTVSTADELAAAIAAHEPGDTVRLAWTDASGASQQASVTLGEGPVG